MPMAPLSGELASVRDVYKRQTPLIEKLWKLLSRNDITKAMTILVLLTVSMAYVVGSTNSPFLYFNF